MAPTLPHDAGRNFLAVFAWPSRMACNGVDDAGRLELELDRAVRVEIPEQAIFVVGDRRDGCGRIGVK